MQDLLNSIDAPTISLGLIAVGAVIAYWKEISNVVKGVIAKVRPAKPGAAPAPTDVVIAARAKRVECVLYLRDWLEATNQAEAVGWCDRMLPLVATAKEQSRGT